ncbi:MAG: peptide deformylase [Alphaproteobacteria bacterium]|nr:peptide deformylase [Alphaproteobacteria bacterium]
MAIRKIARMGHDILRGVATAVDDPTAPDIRRLAEDLIETCEDIGGNGIAAPQVYVPKRLFVFRVRPDIVPDGATMGEIPWTSVINPKLTFLSDAKKPYWERCLSLPGLFGQVPRYNEVQLDAVGLDGKPYRWKTRGFVARLLQHEYDHLDGILYPMRMTDMTTFGFVSELGTPAYPPLPFDREDFADPEIA